MSDHARTLVLMIFAPDADDDQPNQRRYLDAARLVYHAGEIKNDVRISANVKRRRCPSCIPFCLMFQVSLDLNISFFGSLARGVGQSVTHIC